MHVTCKCHNGKHKLTHNPNKNRMFIAHNFQSQKNQFRHISNIQLIHDENAGDKSVCGIR